jgi:hypothetical protein
MHENGTFCTSCSCCRGTAGCRAGILRACTVSGLVGIADGGCEIIRRGPATHTDTYYERRVFDLADGEAGLEKQTFWVWSLIAGDE